MSFKCSNFFSYNGERLNNALKRVKKFGNWREPIPEAYYPKLDSLTSSRGWPPRQAGMRWQNLKRPVDGIDITLEQMEEWRRRLEDAVSTGRVRLVSFKLSILWFSTSGCIPASPCEINSDPSIHCSFFYLNCPDFVMSFAHSRTDRSKTSTSTRWATCWRRASCLPTSTTTAACTTTDTPSPPTCTTRTTGIL